MAKCYYEKSNWKNDFLDALSSSDEVIYKQAINIVDNHIPINIYKYRNINKNNIINFICNTLWCSTLDKLNDTYEGYVTFQHEKIYIQKLLMDKNIPLKIRKYDILKDMIHNSKDADMIKKYQEDTEITENTKRKFVSETQKKKKVCSFSTLWDNRLIWAHYASNYTGFCIEYNVQYNKNNISKINGKLLPIVYRNKIWDITEDLSNYIQQKVYSPKLNEIMPIIKDSIWKYENEWRIVINKDESCKISLKPQAIYLGKNINYMCKVLLKCIAKLKQIEIYEVDMDINNYKLIRKQTT